MSDALGGQQFALGGHEVGCLSDEPDVRPTLWGNTWMTLGILQQKIKWRFEVHSQFFLRIDRLGTRIDRFGHLIWVITQID